MHRLVYLFSRWYLTYNIWNASLGRWIVQLSILNSFKIVSEGDKENQNHCSTRVWREVSRCPVSWMTARCAEFQAWEKMRWASPQWPCSCRGSTELETRWRILQCVNISIQWEKQILMQSVRNADRIKSETGVCLMLQGSRRVAIVFSTMRKTT